MIITRLEPIPLRIPFKAGNTSDASAWGDSNLPAADSLLVKVTTDQGLIALVQKPTTNPVPGNWKQGGYLERLPKDPWGSDYQYLSPGVRGEIDIFSLGADRARGGEGSAADIGNWD